MSVEPHVAEVGRGWAVGKKRKNGEGLGQLREKQPNIVEGFEKSFLFM
jgi:hypothetical protein